jgi:hypothetical protein
MNFNKEEYWENRKKGLRGQGKEPDSVVKKWSVDEWKKATPEEKKGEKR